MDESEFEAKLAMFKHVRGPEAVLDGAFDGFAINEARCREMLKGGMKQSSVPKARGGGEQAPKTTSTNSSDGPSFRPPAKSTFWDLIILASEAASRHAADSGDREVAALLHSDQVVDAVGEELYRTVGSATIEDLEELCAIALKDLNI